MPDRLTEIIDAVENGEEYTIIRDGKPVAVVLNPRRYADLVDSFAALPVPKALVLPEENNE